LVNRKNICKYNSETGTHIYKLHFCTYLGTRIRLYGGASPSDGRLEVFHNQQWGTVCDDGFDQADARVICFQLGYNTTYVCIIIRLNIQVDK
jgi:hypothetical protein